MRSREEGTVSSVNEVSCVKGEGEHVLPKRRRSNHPAVDLPAFTEKMIKRDVVEHAASSGESSDIHESHLKNPVDLDDMDPNQEEGNLEASEGVRYELGGEVDVCLALIHVHPVGI